MGSCFRQGRAALCGAVAPPLVGQGAPGAASLAPPPHALQGPLTCSGSQVSAYHPPPPPPSHNLQRLSSTPTLPCCLCLHWLGSNLNPTPCKLLDYLPQLSHHGSQPIRLGDCGVGANTGCKGICHEAAREAMCMTLHVKLYLYSCL